MQPAGTAIAEEIFCQACGYNLRGLTGEVCPECGGSLAGVRSEVCAIPWVHRKELGWWRAYRKTIALVMFRQRRFAEEMARPVSYRDSQLFRWITVAITCIPMLASGLAVLIIKAPVPAGDELVRVFWSNGGFGALWHACFVLYVAAATGLPSYFFHPRDVPVTQQNRAIALSYYACGPLAFLAIPIVLCAAAILTSNARDSAIPMLLMVFAMTLPIGAIAPWWLDLIHLSRRLVPQNPRRALAVALVVPLLWFLLALLILLAVPFTILGIVGVFLSLD